MFRTHTCGELTKKNTGQTIELAGWVQSRRDHGGLIFIDLRDRYGLTQLTFDPKISKSALTEADKLRHEWVIKIKGKVASRPDDMINKKLKTGEIEIECEKIEILSKSKTPPFELNEEKTGDANEALRLKYRFVDLRRSKLQSILKIKDEFFQQIRKYFQANGFIEIQTPILANSSPEGARDFLVPSRFYPGKFYALPQAPQQFKQLLMVGGLDKYFQIAPCFRDEDPRMDRHYGEFYQLDMEMSFVEQEDVWTIMEPLWKQVTKKFSNKKLVALDDDGSFKKIPWRKAMQKYGTDKPDLRFDLEIKPVTEIVKDCGFSVFTQAIKIGGVVHAMKVDGAAKFSRKEIDELTEVAKTKGAKGLAYIVIKSHPAPTSKAEGNFELQSPIVKFLGHELAQKIVKHFGAKAGDIIFFGADTWKTVCLSLGAVRNECASKLGLKDNTKAAWCWVVDFPMYDYSETEDGRIDFGHNPFSMPHGGMEALQNKNPLEILAQQFDLVLNGFEVSSGAIRNHEPEIMYKAFSIAGYTKEEVDNKFGAMVRAFEYGAPPHGGNAPGVDRILMVLLDLDSIRDIYAFPKDGKGRDVMMDSPSAVEAKQLKELNIKIN
ncbi:aspartate--tRNA ligase [Patescibacteria group bacterium]|nr:aspartate--tRNA ligase [Patescibacteria group bacterium]MBU1663123.1 aspartate--tRNA ligase [Patescibacteria group bacterium]MBU1933710.1 aspartate--tRNA ligase [Patescibacteria group bacterium]MBU2008022.1 aspartate--tRNA ligase [Patescibacteria group bacterium]MBU2233707.1 aspartate--tRNA ligase [Patescibacteria group bacterium]